LTIGYGTTAGVKAKQVITEAKAEELLAKDLRAFETSITNSVKVPLQPHQFDALAAFVYNVGVGSFKGSTLLKELNKGNYDAVPAQMLRWNKGGGKVLAGLTRRRTCEAHLFATGEVKF
jgi:lysozyme